MNQITDIINEDAPSDHTIYRHLTSIEIGTNHFSFQFAYTRTAEHFNLSLEYVKLAVARVSEHQVCHPTCCPRRQVRDRKF